MPPRLKSAYVCSECGFETPRWFGKCPECGEWNTLSEYVRDVSKAAPSQSAVIRAQSAVTLMSSLGEEAEVRIGTGLAELDRVLGGGIVGGSVTLLSGDPGIGKSTLLLQMCRELCRDKRVLYIAGEESPRQVKMRASRVGLEGDNLFLAAVTDAEAVISTAEGVKPDIVMVDSIQTMTCAAVSSPGGSVTQVRECARLLIQMAKSGGTPVFIVGHVNKDGGIAGPKVLEHMVDAVLYFEGERHSSYRILRAVKNRFGATNEIGVFEMGENGLSDVDNPSLTLLAGRPSGVSGTCVACVMEGMRPILAEAQALVGKTAFGVPRRMTAGFDLSRAALLIAVLEKRAGYFFGNLDAYINIIGGLKLDDPAADLPVALALASNLLDKQIPDNLAAFGEIGLAGEIRSVSHAQLRVNECVRLGFTKLIIPASSAKELKIPPGAEIMAVNGISQAFRVLSGNDND